MKGLVFREFLGMVEKTHGYEMVDTIIENSALENNGVYTSVGTYPHSELVQLVVALSKATETPIPKLLFEFGKYVFDIFRKGYPDFFKGKTTAFELLNDVENVIHVEVLKLYPDAELPSFENKSETSHEMEMIYRSNRKMADFAEGLIEGALLHFKQKGTVERKDMNEEGSEVLFHIKITK